jgi:hypothetical protein
MGEITRRQISSTLGESTMKYMLMIYNNEAERATTMTPADLEAEWNAYYAYSSMVDQRTTVVASEALHDIKSATTVRVRDGKTVSASGPFAETNEQLGGFYLLDCKDLDEAIELAAQIPGAKNGSVEIRPCVVFG